jgi:hypothetical protein
VAGSELSAAQTPEARLLRLGGMVRSTRPDLADWTREVEAQLKELRESLKATWAKGTP